MLSFDNNKKLRLIEPHEISHLKSLEMLELSKRFVNEVSARKKVTRIDIDRGYVFTTCPEKWV